MRNKYCFQKSYYLFWIVFVLVLLIIAFMVPFPHYLQVIGIVVREEDYYVKVYLEDDQIMHLHSTILMMDQKSIPFKIVRISDYYFLDEKKYREVLLSFEIEEKQKIENNTLSLIFLLGKKTWVQTLQEIWRRSCL